MNPSSAFAKIHARRCPNIAAPGDGRTPAWTDPRAKTNFQTRSKFPPAFYYCFGGGVRARHDDLTGSTGDEIHRVLSAGQRASGRDGFRRHHRRADRVERGFALVRLGAKRRPHECHQRAAGLSSQQQSPDDLLAVGGLQSDGLERTAVRLHRVAARTGRADGQKLLRSTRLGGHVLANASASLRPAKVRRGVRRPATPPGSARICGNTGGSRTTKNISHRLIR